jgi:hypothetical protein
MAELTMNRQRYGQHLLQTEVTACICKENNKAVIKEMLRLHPPGPGRYVLLLKHAAAPVFFFRFCRSELDQGFAQGYIFWPGSTLLLRIC